MTDNGRVTIPADHPQVVIFDLDGTLTDSAAGVVASFRHALATVGAEVPAGDLAATLKASGQYSTLLKALDASNLTALLSSAGPLTIVAPTDAAFAALPAGTLDNLLKPENGAQLQALLLPHIINASVTLDKIQGNGTVPIPNVAGGKLTFDATVTNVIKINDANVVAMGKASNGEIYAVDKVLSAQ